MSRIPSQKGTSVLPVVVALMQRQDCRELVPAQLWKYFDEPVLVSGWYPEADYWVLLGALVQTIDAATLGGDVWRYFAKFSAQRDIGGRHITVMGSDVVDGKGVYRTYGTRDPNPEKFFQRATRLWSQYHDSGRLELIGGRHETNSVRMRLSDFHIPLEGFVRLQGYYLEEYGQLVGIDVVSQVTRSTALSDPCCEWEHRLARTPATEAYVASLQPFEAETKAG